MSDIRELARGRWAGLLGQWLDERALSGKSGPCPVCKAGKDRFRFDNKDGAGTWYCNNCGAGDGFMLLQELNGWTFQEAARYVENKASRIQPKATGHSSDPDKVVQALKAVWEGARPVQDGDPVAQYLKRRAGRQVEAAGIRCHPALPYRHEDGTTTRHPAMVARVVNAAGKPVSLHRTYLTDDGQKAAVPIQRKLMTPTEKLSNVSIRFAPPIDGWLGVAEGIETALCAAIRFQVPMWSCISAGMLRSFRPPEGVKLLFIMGDNDVSFTGQEAAYWLAKTVSQNGIECRVYIPDDPGTDWAD